MPDSTVLTVRCAIVGGGPAGMMLGWLLARAGVEVVVLEKHADFLRDFRGDTIHPSTLELLYELGVLAEFLKRPHQQASRVRGVIGDEEFTVADFSHLPTQAKFIAFMPQWDFLDFVAEQARRYATFRLVMQAEVIELVEAGGRVVGVRAKTPQGPLEVRAELVVGCDGRASRVRAAAGLEVLDLGAPIDVLWMRIARRAGDPEQLVGRFNRGIVFVMIDRGDYWQCGYVIRKGGIDELKREGLAALREKIERIAPFLADGRLAELDDWEKIRLLTVKVDRLHRWCREGLVCIGDAAHAMSPVGGVGINLAIQDAVAAANLLAAKLREGKVSLDDLQKVQERREMPTRWTQRLQLFIHRNVINRVVTSTRPTRPAWYVRLLLSIPWTRRVPARVIGIGFRPEHVRTEDAFG
jgi:2-polyprenyl-6-methoxyphenol hydroxylase-like FAD-dependent oxidoreductase